MTLQLPRLAGAPQGTGAPSSAPKPSGASKPSVQQLMRPYYGAACAGLQPVALIFLFQRWALTQGSLQGCSSRTQSLLAGLRMATVRPVQACIARTTAARTTRWRSLVRPGWVSLLTVRRWCKRRQQAPAGRPGLLPAPRVLLHHGWRHIHSLPVLQGAWRCCLRPRHTCSCSLTLFARAQCRGVATGVSAS